MGVPKNNKRTNRTISFDFDGVINSYTSGWKGADKLPDPPVPGAIEFIRMALGMFKVVIFSTRAETTVGVQAIRKYLLDNGLGEHEVNAIKITDKKIKATLYIDDRGYQFNGTFPTLDYLREFQPWYKRDDNADDKES